MMMKNYNQSGEINHSPNWPYIPDHPYRILLLAVQDKAKLMCY